MDISVEPNCRPQQSTKNKKRSSIRAVRRISVAEKNEKLPERQERGGSSITNRNKIGNGVLERLF